MQPIELILILYGAAALFAALLYIPKLVQFLHCFFPPAKRYAREKRRIALLIPARDESRVIGDLFDSILRQTYDRENFDVNVIVKRADDPTVEMAKKLGFSVFVVPEQTCKGAALDGFFQSIGKEHWQDCAAYCIVDADAVLAPDYVEQLNNALDMDAHIYLSRKRIKNYLGDKKSRSIFCNCSALNYPLLDDMGNFYRMKKGVPLNMCGQGMMVRADAIQKIGGWPYRSLTEDYEMKMDSFLQDFKSVYYPYAVIYTEEAVKHSEAWKRRLRWVMGFTQCDHKYKQRVQRAMREKKYPFFAWYDTFFGIVPPVIFIVATMLASLAGLVLTCVYAAMGSILWVKALLLLVLMPPFLMYLFDLLYNALTMYIYRDAYAVLSGGEKAATLLFSPLFMFEYFPIFLHAHLYLLAGKDLGWAHTARLTYRKGAAAEKAELFYRTTIKKLFIKRRKERAPEEENTVKE